MSKSSSEVHLDPDVETGDDEGDLRDAVVRLGFALQRVDFQESHLERVVLDSVANLEGNGKARAAEVAFQLLAEGGVEDAVAIRAMEVVVRAL